jgi:PAS domain S-box-containing protein
LAEPTPRDPPALPDTESLLRVLSQAQLLFIEDEHPHAAFDALLTELLRLTRSEYGLLGELLHTPAEAPYLKVHAFTAQVWAEELHAFAALHAPAGLEFYDFNNLFGAVLTTGQPVIANEPAGDPRRGGVPDGHPPLRSFLGLPVEYQKRLIGLLGIANRPGGYAEELIEVLQPLLATCGNLLAAFRNAERRRQAEAERERAQEQIAYQASILDQVRNAVVTTDLEARIRYWNRFSETLFQWSASEAIGRSAIELLVPSEQAEAAREIFARILETGHWEGEFQVSRKDGQEVVVFVVGSLLRDATGYPTGVIGVCTDLTERKRFQEQLILSQKMESIGRLAGGVAHDFNNLLTGILGYAGLATLKLPEASPAQPYLTQIHEVAERAASLTSQLLAFARKQVIEPTVLNLNELILRMGKLLRRIIGEDIELVMLPSPDLGSVKADAGQLEQVLMNLAVNARDAMPHGGRLTVETSNVLLDEAAAQRHPEVEPGQYVRISVGDTGTGMSREVMEHLFEPFFTTKESGKGTGLGLASCYGIVRQNRGHIWVSSEPGRGSLFQILLPRVSDLARPPLAPRDAASLPAGTETVLLVEDEPVVRHTTLGFLRKQGYTVLEAADGEEALRLARLHPGSIDLLLTDVVMPHLGGRELAERLAAARPGLRVLYMSGYTDGVLVRDGVLEEGLAFLQKPFSPFTLLGKVREVLDRPA